MSSSDVSSSWQPLPLHRHLSTVGIGPVFVHPPTHYELPPAVMNINVDSEDNAASDGNEEVVEESKLLPSKTSIVKTTWEITGDIKTTPQDFVVREIGWCPPSTPQQVTDQSQSDTGDRSFMNKYHRRKGWRRGIAGLVQSDTLTNAEVDVTDCRKHRNDVATTTTTTTIIEEEGKCTTTQTDSNTDETMHAPLFDEPMLKKKKTSSTLENNYTVTEETSESVTSPSSPPLHNTARSIPSKPTIDISQSPDKILRQVLIQCHDSSHTNMNSASAYADKIMEQISTLQTKTFQMLKDNSVNISCASNKQQESTDGDDGMKPTTATIPINDSEPVDDDTDSVWISTSNLFQDDANKGSWKLLHETVRKVYPLLKTENASHSPNAKVNDGNKDDATKTNTKNAWVCVVVDDCFFSLIPYLLHPADDLLQLYTFRSLGPVMTATNEAGSRSNQTNNRKKNRWKKGKRGNQCNTREEDGSQNYSQEINNKGKVLLHLKPDLPRTERRNIHQIITGKNRKSDFETSTRNEVRISNHSDKLDDMTSEQTTTAIVIQWSRMAVQNIHKKRKREEANNNTKCENNCGISNSSSQKRNSSDIKALFCTLHKEQIEHQVAIQSLTQALKCRPGDIGLAGIKDMKAITSQFCTLRNVDIKRAQRPILDKRVKLSNFVPVTNFLLDRGRLIGNQFEITLRNLKQVERTEDDTKPSSWKERFIPVRSSHINAMVDRVTRHGFINYYGEQRVGDAGHKQFVGVRSFDVGRALLQQNFSLAVDLIMEGRSTLVYNPTQEEVSCSHPLVKNSMFFV